MINLEKLWDDYEQRVYTVALNIFMEEIRPFCVERNLNFLAGNGSWWLGEECYAIMDNSHDPELEKIVAILQTPIRGMPYNNLGSLMPDYELVHNCHPRIRNLQKEEQKPFNAWLYGQTRPTIPDVPNNEQDAFYTRDYKRWKAGLPIID